jgi:hypothetical protein
MKLECDIGFRRVTQRFTSEEKFAKRLAYGGQYLRCKNGPCQLPNGCALRTHKQFVLRTVEALWALGALEPKKGLKRPDVRVGVWWKGC